jgi:hypothetical protein
MVRAGLMEKIMSKTKNETGVMRIYTTETNRCVTEGELERVTGGLIDSANMAAMHYAFTASVGDLLFGDKGFVSDVARRVAGKYR